jgi:hypothetical protein
MKTPGLALALVIAIAPAAPAAPGDPVALRGTLAWPPSLDGEPFAVVRGDDGRLVYADLSAAQRQGRITAGDRISLLGVEGGKAHEVAAVAIGPGDAVLASMPAVGPMATPAGPSAPDTPAPPAAPAVEERPSVRLEGTLLSIAERAITVRTDAGRTVDIDVSKLGTNVLRGVTPGERVTVFAVTEPDQTLSAVGFIHSARRSSSPK